jgi:hypothetical protein
MREPQERIYVQHKMFDNGAEWWRWRDEYAHFYLGDASQTPTSTRSSSTPTATCATCAEARRWRHGF